ncbi:hypothetical protein BJ741DRAFT_542241, partial [Chytriomyces cf. hyalinus JEL632]
DQYLIWAIQARWGVGKVSTDYKSNLAVLAVTDVKELVQTIIPFFDEYPIIGNKSMDYVDF